jgi:hypothetical protein
VKCMACPARLGFSWGSLALIFFGTARPSWGSPAPLARWLGLQGFYPGGTAIAFRQMTNWASRQGFTEAVRNQFKLRIHGTKDAKLTKPQEVGAGIIGGGWLLGAQGSNMLKGGGPVLQGVAHMRTFPSRPWKPRSSIYLCALGNAHWSIYPCAPCLAPQRSALPVP